MESCNQRSISCHVSSSSSSSSLTLLVPLIVLLQSRPLEADAPTSYFRLYCCFSVDSLTAADCLSCFFPRLTSCNPRNSYAASLYTTGTGVNRRCCIQPVGFKRRCSWPQILAAAPLIQCVSHAHIARELSMPTVTDEWLHRRRCRLFKTICCTTK